MLRRAARRRGSGILIRLPATRCLNSFLHFVVAVQVGPNSAGTWIRQEVALHQLLAQFLQALLSEVTHTQQIVFIHRKHLADLRDVAALETVIGAYRQVQLLDGSLVDLRRYRYTAQG